jgi:putative transposase
VLRENEARRSGGCVVKKKRFAIKQITAILKQAEVGTPVADLCRKFGISEQSFYRLK